MPIFRSPGGSNHPEPPLHERGAPGSKPSGDLGKPQERPLVSTGGNCVDPGGAGEAFHRVRGAPRMATNPL
jgi:hypothetical protein